MARVRFKAFGAYHTGLVEANINDWLKSLENDGYYPEIIRKETRVAVEPSTGRAFVVVTFFFTLHKLEEGEDKEVDIDAYTT